MKTFETPAGKEIQIPRTPQGSYKIQFATGGELPENLTGLFTSEKAAEVAVRVYLDTWEPKRKKVDG